MATDKRNRPTRVQVELLAMMVKSKWYTAEELHVSLKTLQSLANKGLMERKYDDSAIESPRTCFKFRKR